MKILIIEEERMLADSLKALLKTKGFDVDVIYDGATGIEYATLGLYDLLILDVTIHGMDSCCVAKRIRSQLSTVPIVILSAQTDMEHRIEGLNSGADYFLPKPFDVRELMACINAIFRRQGSQMELLQYGNTKLDITTCMLVCGEKRVRLSAREFDVMRFLLQSQNRVVPKEMILARVWGFESNAVENHVEVYVGFLRKKLTSINSNVCIIALRRLGYHLEVNNSD